MRQNLRFLLMLLIAIAYGGAMFGQEVTLDFSTNSWGLPTKTAEKAAKSYTNGTYTISFGASNTGHKFTSTYLIMGKTDATLTLPAFDFNVEKIKVIGNDNGSTSVVQNIYVGDVAVSDPTTGCADKNTKKAVTNTYLINDQYQTAGNLYTLKITSSHNTQITKILIYKKEAIATTLSFGTDFDKKTIKKNIG